MNRNPRWSVFALLLVGGLWLTGCGGGGSAPPAPTPTPTPNPGGDSDPSSKLGLPKLLGLTPEVQPETRVLSAAELQGLSDLKIVNPDACAPELPNRVPCAFTFGLSPLPEGLKVGSVLAAGVSAATPDGLLVKVDSLNGGSVQATEARLGDAVKQGEFRGEQDLTEADIRSQSLRPGVSVAPPTLGAQRVGAQGVGITVKANHTQLLPGVYADGQATFNLGCGAYGGLTYSWGIIPTGVKFQASCQIDQTLAMDITGAAGLSLDKEVTLGSFTFSPITFFIGPVPVVLVPKATVYLNLKGQVSASLSFGFSESFQAKGGIKYNDGFSLIHDLTADASAHPVSLQAKASAKAGLNFKASLLLYGVAGASINVNPYLQLDGGPGQNPLWCLKAGVAGGVSLDLDLQIKHLTYGPASLFDKNDALGCASNTPPTLSIEAVANLDADHTIYLLDRAEVALKPVVHDAEDGDHLQVTWTDNVDGALGTSTGGIGTSLYLKTPGPHVITGTVKDAGGAQASATFNVKVAVPVPTVTLTARDTQGAVLPGPAISVHQGDALSVSAQLGYLTSGLPCTALTWDGGGLPLTGGGCQVGLNPTSQGSFTVTATADDGYGHKGSARLTINVGPPPVVPAPAFSQITALRTSPAPQIALNDGDYVYPQDVVNFSLAYTNAAEAKVKARYVWTLSIGDGAPQTLDGPGGETTSSQRSWTAPYMEFVPVVVTVQIYNADTNALIGTRTLNLKGAHIIF